MYTDGLTEAANAEGEEMGVERLIDYFNNSTAKTTKDFVHQALTCVANSRAAPTRRTTSACWASAIPSMRKKPGINCRTLRFRIFSKPSHSRRPARRSWNRPRKKPGFFPELSWASPRRKRQLLQAPCFHHGNANIFPRRNLHVENEGNQYTTSPEALFFPISQINTAGS